MREVPVAAHLRKRLAARALPGSLLLPHLARAGATAGEREVWRIAYHVLRIDPGEPHPPALPPIRDTQYTIRAGTAVLPAWKDALPLWAGESWLWIVLQNRGQVRAIYSAGAETGAVARGSQRGQPKGQAGKRAVRASEFEPGAFPRAVAGGDGALQAFELARYDIIVVDCRAGGSVPGAWWAQLEAALEPGGVIFVCGLRDRRFRSQIASNAPGLRPGAWEVIEAQEEGTWRLRPDSRSAQAWSDRHLNPPFGLRTWLRQLGRRWMPFRRGLACLPVWRELDV